MASVRKKAEEHKKSVHKKKGKTQINLLKSKVKKPKSKDQKKWYHRFFLGVLALFICAELGVRGLHRFKMLGDYSLAYLEENMNPIFGEKINWKSGRNTIQVPQNEKYDWALVGDENLFGEGLTATQNVSHVLTNLSHKSVVSLSAPNLNLKQYNDLVEYSNRYQPNTILYFVSADDFQVKDSLAIRQISSTSENSAKGFPYQILETPNAKGMTWGVNGGVQGLFRYSALVQLLSAQMSKPEGTAWKRNGTYFMMKSKQQWDSWMNPQDDNVQYGIEVNSEFLRVLNHYIRTQKKNLVVFLVPCREMVYSGLNSNGEGIWDPKFNQTYAQLNERLEEMGIKVFNLSSDFKDEARKGNKLFNATREGLSAMGHEKLASIVIEKMNQE